MPTTMHLALDLSAAPRVYPARLHGAACAITGTHGEGHTGPPFAAGPLFDDENGQTWWRIAWLAEHETPPAPTIATFGNVPCPVLSDTVQKISYGQLAGGSPAGHAHLRVVSPLYFSRNGRDYPMPDPVLLLRTTATRWNLHAPAELAVPDDAVRQLGKVVYLAGFAGHTMQTPVSATRNQTGFVGEVHLALVRAADRATRVAFGALVRFAELAGVGAQTTHGFGAIEIEELAR